MMPVLRRYGFTRRQGATLSRVRNTALALLACVVFPAFLSHPAHAQQTVVDAEAGEQKQLLLQADQLIYDNDANQVTAFGDVRLDYDGRRVVAEKVTYNQATRRVTASGNVEIVEPDGTRTYAQEIDLTDDFGRGFVNALRVETTDNTRFAAESAERFADEKTVFNHGVYTACEPCRDKPDRAPLWQVKAQTIILDGKAQTITYKHARLELFGLPIAYLPWFQQPSPDVRRKSGLLMPHFGFRESLGYYVGHSYFLVTGDTHDLTFKATAYSEQGFLGQAEWRQQFNSGQYTLKAAGISQMDKDAFSSAPDNVEIERGMVATTGLFDINTRWQVGWNAMAQGDSRFAKTYDIDGYSAHNITNEVFLRGLENRSYFDLSAYQFLVQGTNYFRQDEQALVHPVLDYNYRKEAAHGGEWSLDLNLVSLTRDDLDADTAGRTPPSGDQRTFGIDGNTTRVSADVGWNDTFATQSGFTLRPSLSLRGDMSQVDGTSAAGSERIDNGNQARFMPTAALEASYPVLARTAGSSHIIEPTAQLLLRPDLAYTGILPNEDSQSLVFDASTLFEHDKFSGYDRIEGGVRANVGLRYAATFDQGFSLTGLFGQSIHLAGRNPYAQNDLVNVGVDSGLQSDRSDYVAALGANTLTGFSLNTQARFDKDDFDIKRGEASLNYSEDRFALGANYIFIAPQPEYGFANERQQVGLSGRVKLTDYWSAFASASYDVTNDSLIKDQIGLTYHDECFTFTLAFTETRSRYTTDEANRSVRFRFSLRTLGDFDENVSFDSLQSLSGNSD